MSPVSWFFIRQRIHHFSLELIKRGSRIVFLHLYEDFPARLPLEKKGRLYLLNLPLLPLRRRSKLVMYLQNRFIRFLHSVMLDFVIKIAFLRPSLVLVATPHLNYLVHALKSRGLKIVYDRHDDFSSFSGVNECEVVKLEKELVGMCDGLIYSSTYLQLPFGNSKPTAVIPNGVDFSHFDRSKSNEVAIGLERPIIGYVGTISDWFDFDLLRTVAIARPRWNFLLIGPWVGVNKDAFSGIPNVIAIGQREYSTIPLYVAGFDVGIIPFKINRLTEGVDPVKMYEYLAAGKPVVATDIPAIDNRFVRKAKNIEEFARYIEEALAESRDPELVKMRKAFARANSWSVRGHQLLSFLASIDGPAGRSSVSLDCQ